MEAPSQVYSADPSRSGRYEIMDGLRGVAAIGVLFFHFALRLRAPALLRHGYLAVDFFFMLSGFVLSHAYSERLGRAPLITFGRLRALRLLPLSMLGVVLGAAYLLLRWRAHLSLSDSLPQILGAAALNLALIPKLWIGSASADQTFPIDTPLWSLSFELLVNLLWAGLLLRARTSALVGVTVLGAALLTVYAAVYGDANIGWGWGSYLGGAGRTLFGFFIGVVIWRLRPPVGVSRAKPIAAAAILLLVFWWPADSWVFDVVAIVLVMPLLLLLCASADFGAESHTIRALGDMSYPLYAVHYPILMLIAGLGKRFVSGAPPGVSIYLFAIPLVLLALTLGRWYDGPVRRWLGRKALTPPPPPAAARTVPSPRPEPGRIAARTPPH
jgi:peptidoglycan/LPS O-acetylase OafA/YrhL